VIKKGGLTFLENKTISGHLITIISEDRQVCTPTQADHTGVYLKGRFLKVNKDGQVIIPYSDKIESSPIILVHEDFADLGTLQILTE